MADKKELIEEIKNKFSKTELKKKAEKHVKITPEMGKKEIITKLSKLKQSDLEEMLGKKPSSGKGKEEEKVIEISLKPNKWMIPVIAIIAFLIIISTGILNPQTASQKIVLTYILDSTCPTCYDVSVNEQILTQQYGLTLTTQTFDASSTEGKALISKYKINKIPTFIVTGVDQTSNAELLSVWTSVGTVETDGTLVFRAPEVISEQFKVLNSTTGVFAMYVPPESTIGGFLVMKDSLCLDNGTPAVYFFGSTSCPHCQWEHPIITNVTALFGSDISFKDEMGTENNMEIFTKYLEYNKGGVPFTVIGCKYIRVGSGEAVVSDNETIAELNKTVPQIVSESLAVYAQALVFRDQALAAYQRNDTSYIELSNKYTELLKQASIELDKQVLINLICNVTNNKPASVCI